MNRKLPIVATALVLVLAVVWVALRVFGADDAEREVATRAPAVPTAPAEAAEPAELTAPEDVVPPVEKQTDEPEPARQVVEVAPEAPAAPAWRAEGEQWLEGRVDLPAGAPTDERVIVVALNREMTAGGFYDGAAQEVWKKAPELEGPLVSYAAAEPDGSFKIALPADAGETHLALSARYTFSRRTTAFALPAPEPPVLRGELGARITGTVKPPPKPTAEESDLEGLVIGLGPDISGGFDAQKLRAEAWENGAASDAEGRFEIRAVNPALPAILVLADDRFAVQMLPDVRVEPGQHLELEIAMLRGATVRGRVVDAAGAPVEGAMVEAKAKGIIGQVFPAMRDAETGADGTFELAGVAAGGVDLAVEREGYRPARQELGEVFEGTLVDDVELVLERGVSLTGRVAFPDGAPAADVKLVVSLAPSPFAGMQSMQTRNVAAGESDADGRFAISGLAETKYEVVASLKLDEGDHAGIWLIKLKDVVPAGEDLELVLEGIVPLRGRVTDVEDDPVTAFSISASQGGGAAMFGMGEEHRSWFFEDDEGAFVIDDLESGTWQVDVNAAGFARSESREVETPAGAAEELVFVLEPAAAVEGVVVDPGGNPVPGAKVTLELDLAELMRFARSGGGGLPETRCDQEGRFRLANLNPGTRNLIATHQGYAGSDAVACDVETGETVEGVVLQLRVGGILTGELYDDDGKPDSGKAVIVQKMPNYGTQHIVTTDVDGAFRAENLEPGNWQVVSSGNFLTGGDDPERGNEEAMADFIANMKMEFVDIEDGEETHVVLGAPADDPLRFHGRVTHAGEPVGDALLIVMPADATSMSAMQMEPTAEDGTFELMLERTGPYQITVQQGAAIGQANNVEFSETIPDGAREHEFDIELPVGRISGRVTGPDGKPLAGARVTLNIDGGIPLGSFLGRRYVDTTTDDDGNYDLPYLAPNTYSVGAGGTAFGGVLGGESPGGRVVKNGIQLAAGEWLQSIDFRLEEPGVLNGLVQDESGLPVQDAAIYIRDASGRLLEYFTMVTTDAGGRFSYKGLAPGDYTFSARTSTHASAESEPVRVPAGGEAQGVATLTAGTILIVTVVDQSSKDVDATVSLRDASGRELGSMRSMQEMMDLLANNTGERAQRMGPFPPGRYDLFAETESGQKTKKTVTLAGQPERRIELRVR